MKLAEEKWRTDWKRASKRPTIGNQILCSNYRDFRSEAVRQYDYTSYD